MTPAQLTFEDSGKGSEVLGRLTLAAVQQLCVECGFEKKAAGADKYAGLEGLRTRQNHLLRYN